MKLFFLLFNGVAIIGINVRIGRETGGGGGSRRWWSRVGSLECQDWHFMLAGKDTNDGKNNNLLVLQIQLFIYIIYSQIIWYCSWGSAGVCTGEVIGWGSTNMVSILPNTGISVKQMAVLSPQAPKFCMTGRESIILHRRGIPDMTHQYENLYVSIWDMHRQQHKVDNTK